MGHYYADLMCDKCGKLRCICPPKKTDHGDNCWMVADNYQVIRVSEFRQKRGPWGFF